VPDKELNTWVSVKKMSQYRYVVLLSVISGMQYCSSLSVILVSLFLAASVLYKHSVFSH